MPKFLFFNYTLIKKVHKLIGAKVFMMALFIIAKK